MKEVSWLLFTTRERLKKNRELALDLVAQKRLVFLCFRQRHLLSCKNTILQKLSVTGSKRVAKLFYKALVAVVSEHMKYGSFVVQSDTNLEVIFHCRRDFPKVRITEHMKYGSFVVQSDTNLEVIFHCRRDFPKVGITELHAKLEDVVASSDGSNPNPTFNRIGGSSSSAQVTPVVQIIPPCVASPSFAADLYNEDDDGCDLGDNRTFGELVADVANNPHNVPRGAQISEPEGIEKALGDDEDDNEPAFIIGDSDDDHQSIPGGRSVPSSSRSRKYPAHFSALDLEVVAPTQEENDAGVGFGGGAQWMF
ncbi:hypothetical protein PIB30_068725 [Stylosanthes scabra]|uniref:Uncharacterized protein n=1 Tax=Stylosanthes scabra TaxID=79078 RepID=A0ABU6YNR7_9FABA|nr:hypothetical protein [Stylosanthes scabra]